MSSFSCEKIIDFEYTENTQHKSADRKGFSTDPNDHHHLYHFHEDSGWATRNPIPTPSGVPKMEMSSIPGFSSDLHERYFSRKPDVVDDAVQVTRDITTRFLNQTLAISTFDEFCILTWLVKRIPKQFGSSDCWTGSGGMSRYSVIGILCPFFGEHSKSSPNCICWPATVNRGMWKFLYPLADRCMLVIDNRFIELLSTEKNCVFIKPHVMEALKRCNEHWRPVFPFPPRFSMDYIDPMDAFLEKCFNLVLRWARCFGLFERYPNKTLFKPCNFMVQYGWITDTQYLTVMEKFCEMRNGGLTHGQVSHMKDASVFVEKSKQAFAGTLQLPSFGPRGQVRKHEMPPSMPPFGAAGPAYGPWCGGPPMGYGSFHCAGWQGPPGYMSTAGCVPFGNAGPAYVPGPAMHHPGGCGGFPGVPPNMGMAARPPSPPPPQKSISLLDNHKRREDTMKHLETPQGKKDLELHRKQEIQQNVTCSSCKSDLTIDCAACKERYLSLDLVSYHQTTLSSKSGMRIETRFSDVRQLQPDDAPSADSGSKRGRAEAEQAGAKRGRAEAKQAGASQCTSTKKKKKSRSPRQTEDTHVFVLDGRTYCNKEDCECENGCQCGDHHQDFKNWHIQHCVNEGQQCTCSERCFCSLGDRCICKYHTSTGGKDSNQYAPLFSEPPDSFMELKSNLDDLDADLEEGDSPKEKNDDAEKQSKGSRPKTWEEYVDHSSWIGDSIDASLHEDKDSATSAAQSTSKVSGEQASSNSGEQASSNSGERASSNTGENAESITCLCKKYCFCDTCCIGFNPGDPCRCIPTCTCARPMSQGGKGD